MSPRAACRLESLGFTDVYDYAVGKAAWLALGLPVEGSVPADERVGALARKDAPTCHPGDNLGEVPAEARDWGACVVVDDSGVVCGLLEAGALLRDHGVVDDAMRLGPRTFRPSYRLDELRSYFERHDTPHALVTTLEGRLIGLVLRDEVVGRAR
jgi:hypothetical protein